MKRRFPFTLLLGLLIQVAWAQTLSHGPVIGGVTDTSARCYVKTGNQATPFDVLLDTDSTFSAPRRISSTTLLQEYGSRMLNLTGLQPATQYFYRIEIGGSVEASGRFKTFLSPGTEGYQKIVFGSCNYMGNPSLFEQIENHKPDVFIHLGDWGYSPATYGAYHMTDDSLAALSFALRYSDNMMADYILPNMAVDYIYDDDYTQNGAGATTYPSYSYNVSPSGEVTHNFTINDLPPGVREGAIEGYVRNFPGYPLVDSSAGIHHSIRMGNVEIFMVDNRLNSTSEHQAFRFDAAADRWVFDPPAGHTNIGVEQREWLLNALEQSDAEWKIVGSGVAFNAKLREVLDLAMVHQDTILSVASYNGSGATLATSMAYMWAGYPEDINPLLDLYQSGRVENLFMVTGDTHSSALDNGDNAGIPEMNTSGLAAGDEAFFNILFSFLAQSFDRPDLTAINIWNGGGNGIRNANFTDTYGVVEVFHTDSLRMCVYDELAQNLGCITYYHSSKGGGNSVTSIRSQKQDAMFLAYPNPAKDVLNVQWRQENVQRVQWIDANGRVLQTIDAAGKNTVELQVGKYASGTYFVVLETPEGQTMKRVVR